MNLFCLLLEWGMAHIQELLLLLAEWRPEWSPSYDWAESLLLQLAVGQRVDAQPPSLYWLKIDQHHEQAWARSPETSRLILASQLLSMSELNAIKQIDPHPVNRIPGFMGTMALLLLKSLPSWLLFNFLSLHTFSGSDHKNFPEDLAPEAKEGWLTMKAPEKMA